VAFWWAWVERGLGVSGSRIRVGKDLLAQRG